MPKRMNLIITTAVLVSLLLSACGPAASPTPVPPPPTKTPKAGVALKITGADRAASWTMDELKAMESMEVAYTAEDGTITNYTGVPIYKGLLKAAGVEESLFVVLLSGEGDQASLDLDAVRACDNCLVAFDPAGGLRSVIPGESGAYQIENLVEIRIWGTKD